MLRVRLTVALMLFGALAVRPAAAEIETVAPAGEVGPWPVVSQIIGYRDRIWFANSVKGVNHNAADLYTFDPATGALRFERALFSQDAGDPVVAAGRLFWPLEDPRSSVGWGEVTVTDGTLWRRLPVPSAQAFHAHAMVLWDGRLIAATSAWRAGFQVSEDLGLTWRALYDHPTPPRRVSRVVKLAAAQDFFAGHLIDVGRHRLLVSDGHTTSLLDGWDESRNVVAMAATPEAVFVAANGPGGGGLWRSDGATLSKIAIDLPDGRIQDLHSAGGRLWLLISGGGGGSVWSSPSGERWRQELALTGGSPWDLYVEGGAIYVGGTGASGRGVFWAGGVPIGPHQPQALPDSRFPDPQGAPIVDWNREAQALDRLLAGMARSGGNRSALRNAVYRLAMAGPPEGFFASRLRLSGDGGGRIPMIGGLVQVANRDLANWLLLWGMGLAREQGVPVELLLRPWTAETNGAEKYFEPTPAALWVLTMGGQRDAATIAALIERLGYADDPDWLRNHVAATLATLTGQPKRWSRSQWADWWAKAAADWPRASL
ncbi:MAG TPA: hypothetical protein EYP07_09875 [Kiloniellaceae bacterium]|nr:hypothetical protein [Kiloniellaceae bacterium]